MKRIQDKKIEAFIEAEKQKDKAENELEMFFRNKHKGQLSRAKTMEDFTTIKNELRQMPECASKVLIFRTIIMTQDEVLGTNTINQPSLIKTVRQ